MPGVTTATTGGESLPFERRSYIQKSPFSLALKRLLDVILVLIGLIVAVPLFLLIAALIKLDSRGPVFYKQTRVGRCRRNFLMWKFRKMYEDLPRQGPSLTSRYDFRLTRVGRFLERTKLDELPQLINVLAGDMSVVGPRPEVPKFVEHYPEKWDDVLSVKPGIFGPNQLRHRNESELYPPGLEDIEAFYVSNILPEKLDVDAEYARRSGVVHDLWLLARGLVAATFGAVTWRTVVTRRYQILNLAILSAVGIGGMAISHIVTGHDLGGRLALHAIVLAALVKPAFLIALRIPKSLATSLTADDYQRAFWCAVGSAAAIVFGMFWLGHRDMGRLTLILDTGFFLGALYVYKLVMYCVHVTFFIQESRVLARRLIWAAMLIAPASMVLTATIRHGPGVWNRLPVLYLSMSGLALLIRPVILLLLRAPSRRPGAAAWLIAEWPHLLLATLAGSTLMVMGSLLVGLRIIGRGDILLDAVLFNVALTLFALRQNALLTRQSGGERSAGEGGRQRFLIVGHGIELSAYVGALMTLPEDTLRVAGIVTPEEGHRTSTVGGHPVIGHVSDLPEILDSMSIEKIVVLPEGIDAASHEFVRKTARRRGCTVIPVTIMQGLVRARDALPGSAGADPLAGGDDPRGN